VCTSVCHCVCVSMSVCAHVLIYIYIYLYTVVQKNQTPISFSNNFYKNYPNLVKFEIQHQQHVLSQIGKPCKVLVKRNQSSNVISMTTLKKMSVKVIAYLLIELNRNQLIVNGVKLIEYVHNDDPQPSHKP